jgi:hypothetical protein
MATIDTSRDKWYLRGKLAKGLSEINGSPVKGFEVGEDDGGFYFIIETERAKYAQGSFKSYDAAYNTLMDYLHFY